MPKTYFEDVELHQALDIGEWHVSQPDCVAFAERWEPQPHHVDEAAAAGSVFGRLTVCSLYLFAICTRLFFDYERPFAVLAMLGKDGIVLPNPAYPGDRLLYRTRGVEKRASRSRPDAGILTLEDELVEASGRRVLGQKVTLLLARRPPHEA